MSTRGSKRYSEAEEKALELKRQAFHLVLLSLWVIPILFLPAGLTLMLFFAVILLNLSVVFRAERVYRVFAFLIENLERERNLDRPGIQALYANLGILIAFLLFGKASVVGVLVLSVGDSLSTLVGKTYGKTALPFNPSKSWEGTIAFFVGSFTVLLLLTDLRTALLVSSLSSLVEALDLRTDDNFILPIFATGVFYLV